jgi:hypothetical protein
MRWRHAPSITPVVMGQPSARAWPQRSYFVPGVQVAHAGVRAVSLAAAQADGAGLSGDLLRGPAAVAGQYRKCLGRAPVLGGGSPVSCRLPAAFQMYCT